MENHLQTIFVCITQNVFIQPHRLLLVSTKEVNLYTLHADALHPCHIFLSGYRVVHDVAWSLRSIVLIAVAAVPKQQMNALSLSILRQLFYFLTTNLRVPPIVHQRILKAHR